MDTRHASHSALCAIHFTPWTQLSGAQRSLLALVREQSRHQATAVLVESEGPLAQHARELGAIVGVLGCDSLDPDETRADQSNTDLIERLVARVGAGILHCHSAYGMRWMWPIASQLDMTLVCHQRDNYSPNFFHRDLERADGIIAISQAVLVTLPPNLRMKASVIYNATQAFDNRTSNPRPQIGMAARSIPGKGMHLFLDAVLPLLNHYDFEVSVWGLWSSEDPAVSENVIQRVNQLTATQKSRVHLQGFREDIDEFYRHMDVVVVPSTDPEPFGRVAIEAMAWGCVTIVAGHGGLLETVQDDMSGMVFIPGCSDSLRSKIETALSDSQLCSTMRVRGKERARTCFSLRGHYDAVQSFY
ncbi:MAG: glycosyltransferase family 4 protein, partial [Pseudomonadota bacterium]|nr:glycosyltransferase family 4 protein [Pseudomonadota bacterium]